MAQVDNLSLGTTYEVQRATKPRKPLLTEPQLTAILFILPALLIFLIFVIWPIIQSAHYSVFKWNGLGPLINYVGLNNYSDVLNDPIFWKALGNNISLVVWSLVTQVPLAIFLAILLTSKLKGTGIFRTLY